MCLWQMTMNLKTQSDRFYMFASVSIHKFINIRYIKEKYNLYPKINSLFELSTKSKADFSFKMISIVLVFN